MGILDAECACGACKMTVTGDPLKIVHCQCTTCQKLSGTGHLTNIVIAKGSATLTGPATVYESKADSGNTNTRTFCSKCGSQMLRQNSSMADVDIMHAGTVTDIAALKPDAVIWHKSAVHWDYCDPELPVFDKMPPA